MPSTNQTGHDLVKLSVAILEQRGYTTDHSHPLKVRIRGNRFINVGEDYFKVFDVLAESGVPTLGFYKGEIQVTTEDNGGHRRAKVDERFDWPDLGPLMVKEVWAWNPRREHFVRYRRTRGGFLRYGPVEWVKIGYVGLNPTSERKL